MKTILKVYDHGITATRGMLEDIRVSVLTGREYKVKHTDNILEIDGDIKIIYKTLEDPVMSFNGLTADEVYFDDSLHQEVKLLISSVCNIKDSEKTSMKTEEFYYVVEDKVGSVTRTVRTNDKSLVEALFREN